MALATPGGIPSKEVLKGLLERHTLADIGEMWGVTRQAVDLWRKRYGLNSVYDIRPRKQAARHQCAGCEKQIPMNKAFCAVKCRTKYLASHLKHGAIVTYNYWGCRCDDCRKANADRMRESIAANAKLKKLPKDLPHGRTTTYNYWRCRCNECTAAHSAYCREAYHRRRQEVLGQSRA